MSKDIQKFQPQTMAELEQFGAMIASSQFAPKGFQGKPSDCMIAIAMGAELGLAPMQSLQNIAVINGKPSVYGDAVIGLIRGSGLCEFFSETISEDGTTATATTRRKGESKEESRSFSIDEAKKAGLWGKSGPWTQYPARMLQMRARGFLARDVYADVLKGVITAEEAQDYPAQVQERPVQVTVVENKGNGPVTNVQEPSAPAPSLEEQRQKARAFCLSKNLPVTDDDLEAANTEEKLRDLCRRKPIEKKQPEVCMDFTSKPQFAGSTIGSQNGSN
jgi:hypothetical protein